MSDVISYICNWLGYTLHDGASSYNVWTTSDQYVLMTGCIIIIAFVLTIISIINRVLNIIISRKK